ncbi:MAG: hypothetical protein LBJ26_09465, partial [Paenibacillus sp.]|nr:hypothetical protein [Paenibacillus sp.]
MDEDHGIIAAGRTAELLAHGPERVLKLFREGFPAQAAEEEFRKSQEVFHSVQNVPQPIEMMERDGR